MAAGPRGEASHPADATMTTTVLFSSAPPRVPDPPADHPVTAGSALTRPPAGPDPLVLETADGVSLAGSWRTHDHAVATVVIVHGFSAHREDEGVQRLTSALERVGMAVLTYDARGHGHSGGECAIGTKEHLDVASAARAAACAGRPVVLVGVSMGVVATVRHLATGPPDALAGAVLVSGPARWRMRLSPVGAAMVFLTRTRLGRRVAARHLKVRVASSWTPGEAPETMLGRVRVPVAIVHGAEDRLIASSHGQRLRRAAGGPAMLEIVTGMGHGLDEPCVEAVAEAVDWVLAAAGAVPAAS